jgi:hypothetical protein
MNLVKTPQYLGNCKTFTLQWLNPFTAAHGKPAADYRNSTRPESTVHGAQKT